MKVTTERLENCIVALDIALEEQESTDYLHSAARTLSRNHRVPGFRPGKAPYNVVVRRFGIDVVRNQVIDQFGDQVFKQGLQESGLEPIDQATLEEVTWDPAMALHLKVPVGPEVELGAYRDIRIPWTEPTVTDQELDEALRRLQEEHVEWVQAARPAELGDRVVVDITSTVGGNVVLQNTAREMVLDADSPYPLPGFAGQVVGMQAGESREFDLTYPEDHYNPDTAGQVGHLQVHLHEIKRKQLPPLDDEFAVLVGDYENLPDLRTRLQASLLERAKREAEESYAEALWEQLFQVAQVSYPQVYVDREIEAIQSNIEASLEQQGMDMASYLRLTNTTEEAWKEQVRPQAEERLKQKLILAQVVSAEQITLAEGEVGAEIERMAGPMGDRADEMRQMLNTPQGTSLVSQDLLTSKGLERLKAIARGMAPALEQVEAEPSAGEEAQPVEAGPEAMIPEEPLPEAEAEQATAPQAAATLEEKAKAPLPDQDP